MSLMESIVDVCLVTGSHALRLISLHYQLPYRVLFTLQTHLACLVQSHISMKIAQVGVPSN
jgi:hypothetical protein